MAMGKRGAGHVLPAASICAEVHCSLKKKLNGVIANLDDYAADLRSMAAVWLPDKVHALSVVAN